MKLIRTIRLDPSDTFVFDNAAEPGEWAVSGAFRFWNEAPAELTGKARAAFRSGFLGVASFGWSTLVQIVEATESGRAQVVEALVRQLVKFCGAPDLDAARAAAAEEVEFAGSLCEHPVDTLIAVHRSCDGSEIREAFRTLTPRSGPKPLRAFSFLEVEGEDDAPAETVDLIGMVGERK